MIALFKFGNTTFGEQQDVVEVGPALHSTIDGAILIMQCSLQLNELILSSMQTAFDLCEATKGTVERLFYGSSLQRVRHQPHTPLSRCIPR